MIRLPASAGASLSGLLLLGAVPLSAATELTLDLEQDCSMPNGATTVCAPLDLPIQGDEVWIDFDLAGAAMAHIVADGTALWRFVFSFTANAIDASIPPPGVPSLVLTDMGGPIAGLAPTCPNLSPSQVGCDVVVPGGVFVHDVHLLEIPRNGAVADLALTGLLLTTTDPATGAIVPHQKGVWVPEPGTLALLATAGLMLARRRARRPPRVRREACDAGARGRPSAPQAAQRDGSAGARKRR